MELYMHREGKHLNDKLVKINIAALYLVRRGRFSGVGGMASDELLLSSLSPSLFENIK